MGEAEGTKPETEGEEAMKLTTVMIEWSAIAITLYAMFAVAVPALGTI